MRQPLAECNKMRFHLDKCKVINCKLSNKATSNFSYFLYDTELEYTNNEKDLGVQVVPSLKWNSQHKKLSKEQFKGARREKKFVRFCFK